MASFVYTSLATSYGTVWPSGTAPGGASAASGTLTQILDLSSYIRSVTFTGQLATPENTNFGSGGFVSVVPGLLSATFSFDANDDFASAALDEKFWPLMTGRVLTYFDIKPTSAARSTTNPSVVCAGYVTNVPLGGAVGDVASKSITIAVTGTFTRLTS